MLSHNLAVILVVNQVSKKFQVMMENLLIIFGATPTVLQQNLNSRNREKSEKFLS